MNDGTNTYRMLYIFYLVIQTFSTIYSYVWDIYMDWGLCRCTEPGKYGLRQVINYSPYFYYYAILSDFLLRFTWIVRALIDVNSYPWFSDVWHGTFIGALELFRRWQWALIRIENEQVHNLEKYRHVLDIPEVTDYVKDNKREETKYDAMVKNLLKSIEKTGKKVDPPKIHH